MGEAQGGASGGLFSAVRDIAATLLASGKTRLELLSNEIEVERRRVVELILAALAMVFCFGVGILLVIALLVTLYWEQRLTVLAVGALVSLALGGILLARFRRGLRRPEHVFAASIAELEQDLRQLKAVAGHDPPDR
jgi:uncharacterized membrane protein YqjE